MSPQSRIAEPRHRRLARWGGAVGLLLVLGLQPAGPAQDAAAGSPTEPPEIEITVRAAHQRGQMISVPVHQGVLVDFNLPVREMRIANAGIADVTATAPRQILINGKSFGTTQLVVTVDGDIQRVFTVSVDLDLERLQSSIEATVPRAQVKASALMDAVVLNGTVPDAESAERIMQIAQIYTQQPLNHMRVAGVHQVLLRCTVAEVNRSATRRLGFNGWMAGDNFHDMFAVHQLDGINPVNIGAAGSALATSQIPFATDQGGLNLGPAPALSLGFPRVQMQVFIRALRENGLLRVLAEPNLVTISGQQAEFLAGGEIPIPVTQRDSIAIQYREYGVRLKFTPTVLSDNVIRLQIAPEVSEPDYSASVTLGGFVVPGLIQRKVETVVELGPGQTFSIGGLLSERSRAVSRKIPALGDVPILGALFSSTEYQHSETELVVLVTPELVAPLNPNQVTYVPGTDHVAPNDWELFVLGQIDGEGQPAEAPPAGCQQKDWPARQKELYGSATPHLRGPIGPAGGEEGT